MSNLVDYAKHELELIGGLDDPMQKAINKNILDIVQIFSDQGHTGMTASYALGILRKVLNFKPLLPLTGEENEWNGDQNNRLFSVFKRKDGSVYNSEGKIFTNDGGETWYSCKESFVPITFPYTPPEEPIRVYRYELKDFFDDIDAPAHIKWTKIIRHDDGGYFVEGEIPYLDNKRKIYHLSVCKENNIFWDWKASLGIGGDPIWVEDLVKESKDG